MLDLNESQPSVGVLRDQGFLTGFGIDVKDVSRWGDEDDPRIICNEVTNGNEEGGRTAMEKCLQKDPDINVVYTINEPAAVATEACLITKTDINPFFVKMKEGAEARANELGVKLSFFAGKVDGDHETQVRAIETCIASGAKGILIAASDTKAIVTPLKNAHDNGGVVIAVDTQLERITAAEATV
jgi:ABC-type sugar transport system substrate-binding protein